MRQINRFITLLVGLLAIAQAQQNLGTVAGNMNVPVTIARYFFSGGSYVLGAGFLLAAFFRYMRFRQNPQQTPISMTIVLLLLGLGLIALPFSYELSNYLALQ